MPNLSALLGITVMAGALATMIAILRHSRIVPLVAILTGIVAIIFFMTIQRFALVGVSLSFVAMIGGITAAVLRHAGRRRWRYALSDSGKWRRVSEEFLSESGRWRLRTI